MSARGQIALAVHEQGLKRRRAIAAAQRIRSIQTTEALALVREIANQKFAAEIGASK